MSRASALLGALTSDPTSTADLYGRLGYANLARLGLIPYDAFRAALEALSAAGLATSELARDGSTTWRLPAPIGDRPADRATSPSA